MWSYFGDQSEKDVLFGEHNKTAREELIKHKVEIYCRINSDDIQVFEHYSTISNGVILWFRTQRYIADEIRKIGLRIRSGAFAVKLYIPVLARERKKYVDQLFLAYKKDKDEKFRYLIKPGLNDIEILCKTMHHKGPFR